MKRQIEVRLIVVAAILSTNIFAQASTIVVLREYGLTNPAPQHVVYRQFLRSIASFKDEEESIHHIQESVGISHDEAGHAKARVLRVDLMRRANRLAANIAQAEYDAYCGDDRHSRTKDEVYQIMDGLVSTREQIAEQYYLAMKAEVSSDAATDIDRVVDRRMATFQSRAISGKSKFQNNPRTVLMHVEEMCPELEKTLSKLERTP